MRRRWLLLQHSRADARLDANGHIVLLEAQQRSRWDRAAIQEGTALLEKALQLRERPGPFQLQAVIAANHANAASAGETDWEDIVAAYDALLRLQPTSVVERNRAVAISMASGAQAGLNELDALAERKDIQAYHLYHSARAGLLKRSGKPEAARDAYQEALDLVRNPVERTFLQAEIDALE